MRLVDEERSWSWPRFWRGYDLSKAVAFMRDGGWRLRAHVLVLGRYAFMVAWREHSLSHPPEKQR